MSNAAQSWAWQQEGLLSSDKIVLVALADNAWEDGSNAYPSVALLTRKTGLCRRTVQTALRRLTEAGRIVEQASAMPTKGMPTTYRLIMTPCAESAPPCASPAQGPRATAAPPRASAAPDPAHLTTYPRAAAAPELSTNQSQEQPKSKSLDAKRATKAPEPFVITADLRAWAAKKAPDVDLDRQTERFLDHHRALGSKFLSWTAAWRKWIGNAQDWGGNRGRSSPQQLSNMEQHLALTRRLDAGSFPQGEIA